MLGLLRHGAPLNEGDEDTPLTRAVVAGHLHVVAATGGLLVCTKNRDQVHIILSRDIIITEITCRYIAGHRVLPSIALALGQDVSPLRARPRPPCPTPH